MITRRKVAFAGGIGVLAAHQLALGQTASIRRVGVLQFASETAGAHLRAAFKQGMQDLGWREGTNVEYRFLFASGDVGRLDASVGELIAHKVEVIVTASSPVTRAAQNATKTIPIVMASVSNAVGNGFVASLARPGSNTTGISNQGEDLLAKLVEILHEVVPDARRIAILLNEASPPYATFWAGAQAACATLGLTAVRVVASAPAQLAAAVEQMVGQRVQGVVVVPDGMFLNERARMQELMQPTRLPVAYGWREHVVAGGLLSYAADLPANFRYSAKWVDKILRGAKPADLPVEQPIRFELVINLKTAKSLGLTIPKTVLLRVDEVIE